MADIRPRCVLVADEDPDFLALLRRRLECMGLDVRTASSGKEALESVIECLPDLLCLDAKMSAGKGFTVCEVLALDDEASRIPVILIVDQRELETINRCREMCAYYLCKSDRLWEALESVVQELLDVGSAIPAVGKRVGRSR